MNKIVKYISIIIVFAAIIAVAISILLILQSKKSAPIIVQSTPTSIPMVSESPMFTPTPTSTSNVAVEWIKYTNKTLGFSMSIPEKVNNVSGCGYKDDFVPLKVFEDNANNVVYIVPEYYYGITEDQTKQTSCRKNTYSLQRIRDEMGGKDRQGEYISLPGNPFAGLAVRVKSVKNSTELNKFIKDNYGSGCLIDSKTPWEQQKGVYEIQIKGEDWDKVDYWDSTCPSNGRTLYSPEKGRVMSVKIGQEYRFYSDSTNSHAYDEDIINSFRFE